jgi:hypothetical protein
MLSVTEWQLVVRDMSSKAENEEQAIDRWLLGQGVAVARVATGGLSEAGTRVCVRYSVRFSSFQVGQHQE